MSAEPSSAAAVRVFLPTYRRPHLLQRAVKSLVAQTMRDWICELHNDDPADAYPAELVRRLEDSRIRLHAHERNLGPTATFNLIYQNTAPEPFYAILEDDNWWDANFLETMLAAAAAHPGVSILWSNIRIWQELPNGQFTHAGEPMHIYRPGDQPRLISWGHPVQIHGALHSHGAMLIRSRPGQNFKTPDIPSAVVEMFRERAFSFPLLFVPQPLANFSRTLETARSQDRAEWTALQTMLAATYLKYACREEGGSRRAWEWARAQTPPTTTTLLLASLISPECGGLRRHARLEDWMLMLRGVLGRPRVFLHVLRAIRRHPDWWRFLDGNTAARFAEAAAGQSAIS